MGPLRGFASMRRCFCLDRSASLPDHEDIMIPDHPDASAPTSATAAEPVPSSPEAAELPSAGFSPAPRLPAERRALMAAGTTAAALGLTYMVTAGFPGRLTAPPPKPAP